jgi:hypothetical protein
MSQAQEFTEGCVLFNSYMDGEYAQCLALLSPSNAVNRRLEFNSQQVAAGS